LVEKVEKGGAAMKSYTCTSLDQLNAAFRQSKELLNTKGAVNIAFTHKSLQAEEFDVEKPNKRSGQQNKAIHKYCELLGETLNDAGLDMRRFLRVDREIPWTMLSVKHYIWKEIQIAMFQEESTAEIELPQVSQIYDVIDRNTQQKHGIHVPFPSRHSLTEIHR
jgi:hypothetical protein